MIVSIRPCSHNRKYDFIWCSTTKDSQKALDNARLSIPFGYQSIIDQLVINHKKMFSFFSTMGKLSVGFIFTFQILLPDFHLCEGYKNAQWRENLIRNWRSTCAPFPLPEAGLWIFSSNVRLMFWQKSGHCHLFKGNLNIQVIPMWYALFERGDNRKIVLQ